LKDTQERCGNKGVGNLIRILEHGTQLLFEENGQGERVRGTARKAIAEYGKLESNLP